MSKDKVQKNIISFENIPILLAILSLIICYLLYKKIQSLTNMNESVDKVTKSLNDQIKLNDKKFSTLLHLLQTLKDPSEELSPEKTAVEELSPEKTSVEEITPEKTSVEEITPEKTAVEEITPEKTAVEEITPEKTAVEEISTENMKINK